MYDGVEPVWELYMLYFGRKRPAEQLENLFRAFDPEALTLL